MARFLLAIFTVFGVLLGSFGHSRALPPDPAARGLDVFLDASPEAAPGGRLEITAKAFGFPTVTHAVPLAGAVIEVGWDPEALDGEAPPPSVVAKADADGRAHLAIDVPRGLPKLLPLLVAVRHGGHSRTRSVDIVRAPSATIELVTADTRVVPASTISAWVRVVSTSGDPLANAGVTISLIEGGVARHTQKAKTDRGGLVMARVPIPRIDEPLWSWALRAESDIGGVAPAEIGLTPREETPGTPTLDVAWEGSPAGVIAGERVPFRLRLRDATGQPVIDHAIRYWIGARGTSPPSTDKDWERLSTRAVTDGAGEIAGARDAPTLVKASGTSMVLVARAELEGHALEQKRELSIGTPLASATLSPEARAIVPGLGQKMLLTVDDGRGGGVAGTFEITGDGLATTVTTDAHGEAELTWNAPEGVGASRNVGPCAGGVAAAVVVRPTQAVPALRDRRDPFTLCLPVDRDAEGIVRVTPNVARPGERVKVTLTRSARAPRGAASVVLRSSLGAQAVTTWLDAGTSSGEVALPADAAASTWSASVVVPETGRAAQTIGTDILVVPSTLPSLAAQRVGGRATPGGAVEVEARLTDGHGRGLPGAISAIVVDAFGGGSANVAALDTRSRLCGSVAHVDGPGDARCTPMLERDPSTEALRRALFGKIATRPTPPLNDPGAHASKELERAFAEVLHSLEGAVFTAAKSPQTLLDARRKENGRWVFNPELMTLVTDAMNEPPTTPGGENLVLADLVAVDPQVTFDNVARRVTRLKLFTILEAVRQTRVSRSLDPEEPVFKDPNALLRRLVRDGTLSDDLLLDPWGGTIQYVRTAAAPPPFLGTIRGFELRAPGPDGLVGTGDDVKDPFERVVRSGSPYARAVQEDRIVDAKWDMVVSAETVAAWKRLFEELTGTELGGLGLSGMGEGGGGAGEGIGLGSIGTTGHGGGFGRASRGISTGDAFWTAPVRTDGEGRVRISVPLGGAETTWKIAFVGVPDGLGPASTTLDIASDLPLSLKVDAGARWIEGDVVETHVLVRNRTSAPVRAAIEASAEGAAELATKGAARTIDVPARGARTVAIRVKAARSGEARLVVVARAQGLPDDTLRHTWEIAPAGEIRALTQTAWVEGDRDLGIALDHGYRIHGQPRIVLERGYDDAIAAALESLEPERQTSTLALVDALEAATRIQRWATARDRPRHRALASIAERTALRALGRYNIFVHRDGGTSAATLPEAWTMRARATSLAKTTRPGKADGKDAAETCPPLAPPGKTGDDPLDVEPPSSAAIAPCWGAYVSDVTRALATSDDPERLARAVLALAERPHRAAVAASLADRLREIVKLQQSGDLDGKHLVDRAKRATIYAALLRAQRLGTSRASADALFGKLAVLRDVAGGYGSSSATVYVVRALLASQLEGHGTTRARVRVSKTSMSAVDQHVDVPESGFVVVPLPADALDVSIETEGPGLIARFERPVVRSWSRPPPPQESPVAIDVVWPGDAKAGTTATLRLVVSHSLEGTRDIDVQLPLPPGASLGAATSSVAQIQGVLAIRQSVDRSRAVLEVPIRFGLAGTFTAPEATARVARAPLGVATAPARKLTIH
ncbi:MAG: hypothetical protein KF819_27605 [Labilithrix sp.]|nr:hypothetical protein [Labilithrix sp.]